MTGSKSKIISSLAHNLDKYYQTAFAFVVFIPEWYLTESLQEVEITGLIKGTVLLGCCDIVAITET